MRFIPSSAIPAFVAGHGTRGRHVLYVAARNDPIVYSVEVVHGIVEPTVRPLALKEFHCTNHDGIFGEDLCHFEDPADTVRVETGSRDGDKVIQIVAEAARRENDRKVCLEPPVEIPPGSGNWECHVGTASGPDQRAGEGIRVRRNRPLGFHCAPGRDALCGEYIVGNETKFGAFHGYPMQGNPYILRMERSLDREFDFYVDTSDNPFYHHVVAWRREGPTAAALYYPYVRGLNMTPFMLHPRVARFGLSVDTGVEDSPDINVVGYCEDASGWYQFADFASAPGFTVIWPLLCTRVMFLVGMMAPDVDSGQTLEVGLWG